MESKYQINKNVKKVSTYLVNQLLLIGVARINFKKITEDKMLIDFNGY